MCVVCGGERKYQQAGGILPKTCGQTCANALRRASNDGRSGERNPNYRHGRRAGARDRAGEARWYRAARKRCSACGGRGAARGITLHHVVYRQHLRSEHGDEWDPRNAMPLCNSCHMSHHRRGRVLAITKLPASSLTFAADLFGVERAVAYFRRYYAGDDPRLDALSPSPASVGTAAERISAQSGGNQ